MMIPSEKHREMFARAMEVMDASFGYPLLWSTPKLSSWYAVGLLARGTAGDVDRANKVLLNVCLCQYENEEGEAYGTFLSDYEALRADGSNVWEPTIYGSFDPNNALFVTIAGIVILSLFGDHLRPETEAALRKAMYIATKGDMRRVGGERGDNLYPCYSNPWYMRCVCSAFVGAAEKDDEMIKAAERDAQETIELFDQCGTLSEFNSPTYAGVTLLALSLAQYVPKDAMIYREAPRLMGKIWEQLAETYNPSLNTFAGPFDRTYGFDMTQYCALVGPVVAAATDLQQYPLPSPLISCDHGSDIASVPMQMLAMEYMEKSIPPEVKQKFTNLEPHLYTTEAYSPPFDLRPRKYTFWVEDGLSAGGVEYDHARVGGPNLNPTQWSPGVLLWDTGSGVAWISYYATCSTCSITATSHDLTIRYPPSSHASHQPSNIIRLKLGSIAGYVLHEDEVKTRKLSLPGLEVTFGGNASTGDVSLSYGDRLHDIFHYDIVFTVPDGLKDVPELVIKWKRSAPVSDGFIRA